ncbi:outer membrane lipoprotein-sorting protein [Halodesulfovibrio aestuarii]|uniref:outer membrane lipoprotein-sorting protein n=1 Tax=Halodesulfovibrio aestuarii TaxID=126333 RepID=UPI003521E7D7
MKISAFFLRAVMTGLFLLLGTIFVIPALAITGKEIALKVDAVDTSRSGEQDIIMVVKRNDEKLVRTMHIKKLRGNDCEKQLILFSEPSDVRGTSFLTWGYKDIKQNDDMWVYMPEAALVRRISGGGKKGAFMRSDFANEDISRREVDDDKHALVGEEELYGVKCYVVDMVPVQTDNTNYMKRRVWVRQDIWLPSRIDYYNKSGAVIKRAIFGGYKQIEGIWTATRQLMKSMQRGTQTLLETRKVRYNTALKEEIFSYAVLKR